MKQWHIVGGAAFLAAVLVVLAGGEALDFVAAVERFVGVLVEPVP